MKFNEFVTKIEKLNEPLILIEGEDSFLIDKTIQILKQKIVTNFEDLNFAQVDSENFDVQAIVESCQQLPFASEQKMLLVKNITKITEDELLFLKNYSLSPNPSTCLVIVDKNKIFNLENFFKIDCSQISVFQQKKLIEDELKIYNKTITSEGSEELIFRCDNNSGKIMNELTKLIFYCEQNVITKEDVENVVIKDLQYEVFKLTDFLAKKNSKKTIEITDNLLENKEVVALLGLIYASFRRIFFASISDLSDENLAKILKVKPYAITKSRESAKSFSQRALKKIVGLCEEVDFMLKNGQMSAENCLYYLVFNILEM